MLERLSSRYGVTLREAVSLALDQKETALLDTLSADQRRAYYAGELSLRRNDDGEQDDHADRHGQADVDQGQADKALQRNGEPGTVEVTGDDGRQDDVPLRRNRGERDQRIMVMYRTGMSKRAIARALGISDGTVRNVLKH
jgi:hypothetical protein